MKKVARGKSARVQEDESNAVDVFSNVSSPEDLLAAALAEPVAAPKKAKKGQNAKPAVVEEEAVEVPDAFVPPSGDAAEAPVERPVAKGKKKAKRKKGAIVNDESNAVDVFANSVVNPDDLLKEALDGGGTRKSKKGAKGLKKVIEQVIPDDPKEPEPKPVVADVTPVKEEDDTDFVPDAEVMTEFEEFGEGIADFTLAGRRKTFKEKKKRSTAKTRSTNLGGYGAGGEKYTSVRLEDVSVTFRNTTILQGVTWGVQTGERVGLVGENGCGKTTQLKIIAGQLEPSEGEVVMASSRTKAAFLRQEFVDELNPRRTLREEFQTAFEKEQSALAEYKRVEDEVSAAGDELDKLEGLLNALEERRQLCEDLDAWNIDTRIDKIMPGLGFEPEDNHKLVASFSGGWKVRIGIGKVLMQDPDLLLLDEPSNHLDSDSVEWLEQFLQNCSLPMVIVSHDREFLDRVSTNIVEVEGGEAVSYPGNYSTFVKLKAQRRKAWEVAYEKQQRFIADQKKYIYSYRSSPARVTQVKSRQRMLDRMEQSGQLVRKPPHGGKPLVFRFPPAPRSGREVVRIEAMSHSYGDEKLFDNTYLDIERGDRIAIVGPNGSGKSTLLRMVTGAEQPVEGSVECSSLHNVQVAYYEQNQADALDLDITVLETLKREAPDHLLYEEIRALLGKFLFKGDAVEKKVGSLSGGEKARLALAKIMLKPANVLVLDEPGNHLSISAKEMLEEALQHFDGTLLIVSHDRYLLSQVATQIVAVEDNDLVLYDGDYKAFMEKNDDFCEKMRARGIPGVCEIKSAPKVFATVPADGADKKDKRKKKFGGSGVGSGRVKEMNAKRWKK